jgi:hypothetical protein
MVVTMASEVMMCKLEGNILFNLGNRFYPPHQRTNIVAMINQLKKKKSDVEGGT